MTGEIDWVMFDLYGTLVRFYPEREVIQKKAARGFGLRLTDEGISRGYRRAEAFMAEENASAPLRTKSEDERLNFFVRFEQIVLAGDGHDTSWDLARKIWDSVQSQKYKMVLFPDTIHGLETLKGAGFRTAVITNIPNAGERIAEEFAIEFLMEFVVTSYDAKAEKPDPSIFLKALELAKTQPARAAYVGDQIRSDVDGASAVGMTPILMDRYGHYPDYLEHPRVTSMDELIKLMSNFTSRQDLK